MDAYYLDQIEHLTQFIKDKGQWHFISLGGTITSTTSLILSKLDKDREFKIYY